MTVQSEIARADYSGDGTTITFQVPFRFLADNQLRVLRTVIATNSSTTLVLNSLGPDGYSVIGAGKPNGGSITVVTAPIGPAPTPALAERISILRNVPLTQLIDYIANDAFPAESHEAGLDKLTMMVQQQSEVVDRAVVLPAQSVGVSNELPGPVALNLLRWKADLSGIENAVPPAIATVADGAVVDATVSPIAGIQSSKIAYLTGTLKQFLDNLSSVGASVGGALVGFLQIGTGAVGRTVQEKQQERISVLDFIPVNLHAGIRDASNTTDLKPYIEACFNARSDILTNFIFPAGSYYVASAVNLLRGNCNIIGDRAGITSDNPTSDLLKVGDGITALSNIDIIGMTFNKSVVSTAGYGVHWDFVTTSRVERCVFYGDNKLFGCVWAHRTTRVKVINCDAENLATGGKGVLWTGTVSSPSVDLHMRDCEFYVVPGSGIGLDVQDYTEGLYCRRNTFFQCGAAGVSIAGSTEGSTGFSGKVDQNDFDSCGFGLYSQFFDNLSVTNNWFSANTGTNLRMSDGCSGWLINGNQVYGNSHFGFQIEGDDVVISGNLMTACTDAIVLAATSSGATISGNAISGNSGYGVNKLAAPTNVTIVGNTIRSNGVDQISSGGTNLNVANNLIT